MKIETIKAFISVDANGEEGVCAFMSGAHWIPMVCADEKRVETLRPLAQKIADMTGKKILLARFSVREDVETFTPGPISPKVDLHDKAKH